MLNLVQRSSNGSSHINTSSRNCIYIVTLAINIRENRFQKLLALIETRIYNISPSITIPTPSILLELASSSIPSQEAAFGIEYLNVNVDSIDHILSHQSIQYIYTLAPTEAPSMICHSSKVKLNYYSQFAQDDGTWVMLTQNGYDSDFASLGEFVVNMLNNSQDSCPSPSCSIHVQDHVLYYTHSNKRIKIETKLHETALDHENIYIWTQCTSCEASIPEIQMSQGFKSISFGKYIELLLYSKNFIPTYCQHLKSTHCFRNNIATLSISVEKVKLYDVLIPRVQMNPFILPNTAADVSHPSTARIKLDVQEFYASVREYMSQINIWLHFNPTAQRSNVEVNQMFRDLSHNFPDEEMMIYRLVSETDVNCLNDIRRRIRDRMLDTIEQLVVWKLEFLKGCKVVSSFILPDYCSNKTVHLVPGTSWVIREDEPSSVIAFCEGY